MKNKPLPEKELWGKTVAISGSTGGLGRELCRHFCRLHAESLILLDRNPEKANDLAEDLRREFGEVDIRHIQLDLENIERVKEVTASLCRTVPDILVLNAGAYSIPRHKCSTGYDNVFMINCLSPYYMAKELLPSIAAKGGRILAVGSIAYGYSKLDENDIDFSTRKAASKVYGNAKRRLMLSLCRLDGYGKSVVIAHPGIAVTNITAHYPKIIYKLIKYPMKVIFMSPRKASRVLLCGIFNDCGKDEWFCPRIFNVWGKPCIRKMYFEEWELRSTVHGLKPTE